MKPEIKKVWVDTLKSGTVKQAKDKLCKLENDEYSFCCLGVLCEIYNADMRLKKKKQLEINKVISSKGYCFSYNGCIAGLPEEVQKWSGITTNLGQLPFPHVQDLAGMNDSGKTFKQIAKIIDETL